MQQLQHCLIKEEIHDRSNVALCVVEKFAWNFIQWRFDNCWKLVCNQIPKVYLLLFTIMCSSSGRLLSLQQFTWSIFGSSLAAAATSSSYSSLSSSNITSHNNVCRSLLASVLSFSNDGRWEACKVALGVDIRRSIFRHKQVGPFRLYVVDGLWRHFVITVRLNLHSCWDD